MRLPVLPLLGLALLSACDGRSDPALRVGEVPFTREQVAELDGAERAALADVAGLGRAIAAGELDTLLQPVVAHEAARTLLPVLPLALGARRLGIGEPALREAYAADPEWELRVRHVVRLVPRWASPGERAAARAVAEEVAARARSGADLAGLAARYSQEPGAAERGGLLEPAREGGWVRPFWEAAAALRPGETSGVVETEYGYHVLRLEERRPVPWEEADRARVLRRLVPAPVAEEAMREWIATRPPVQVAVAGPEDPGAGGRALLLGWIALSAEERSALAESPERYRGWAEREAAESLRWTAALRLGLRPAPATEERLRNELRSRFGRAGEALGFRRGMDAGSVAAASLHGVRGRGQESRLAVEEARALRPLLRERYPVSGPVPED